MEIKVLGIENAVSNSLERFVSKAIDDLSMDAKITKVEDIIEIFKYNFLTLPALVIDNEVVANGRMSFDEIKDLLIDNKKKFVGTEMYLN